MVHVRVIDTTGTGGMERIAVAEDSLIVDILNDVLGNVGGYNPAQHAIRIRRAGCPGWETIHPEESLATVNEGDTLTVGLAKMEGN